MAAHENGHLINAAIRNRHVRPGRNDLAGFYLGDGRGFVFDEPMLKTGDVIPFVPPSLRASRFKEYVVNKSERLLLGHLIDEWVCYCHGAHTKYEYRSVDPQPDDLQAAALEMAIYSVAALIAIEKSYPEYQQLTQFRELVAILLRRSWCAYSRSPQLPIPICDGSYVTALRDSPDAEHIRTRMRDLLGTHELYGIRFAAPARAPMPVRLIGTIESAMPDPAWKPAD